MKPYFERDGICLYHADCREILPNLEGIDGILTDPPYGIAHVWQGGANHGWGRTDAQKEERNAWDEQAPPKAVFDVLLAFNVPTIIWGGNYFSLPKSRGWLVWNKPERDFTLAEAELAWTNIDAVIRVCDCRRSDPERKHPTQKPLGLMKWCIEQLKLKSGAVVLDPYAGSGTTLRAAKDLGKKARMHLPHGWKVRSSRSSMSGRKTFSRFRRK